MKWPPITLLVCEQDYGTYHLTKPYGTALYDIYCIFEGFDLGTHRGNHIARNEFCPVLGEALGETKPSVL
jgi:hypothetical protein